MAAFSLTVFDDSGSPVDDVSVGIYTTAGAPIMSAVSDVDGVVLLVTNEASVALRFSKEGYSFSDTLNIEPVEAASYEVTAEELDIVPPVDANLCRVFGTIVDPLGLALPNSWVFKLIRTGLIGDAHSDAITTGVSKVKHIDGFVMFDVVRGSQYTFGPLPISRYGSDEVEDMTNALVNIPNKSTAKLINLIAPIGESLVSELNAVTVPANAQVTLSLELTLTDGTPCQNVGDYIEVESSSGSVQVDLLSDAVKLTWLSQGNATVSFVANRSLSALSGTFYRPSSPKTLLSIEVECEP
jgi:hypothetical protein